MLEKLSNKNGVGVIIVEKRTGGRKLGYIKNPLCHIWIQQRRRRRRISSGEGGGGVMVEVIRRRCKKDAEEGED